MGWLPWKDALAIAIPLLVVGLAWRPSARAPRTLAALLREGDHARLVVDAPGLRVTG